MMKKFFPARRWISLISMSGAIVLALSACNSGGEAGTTPVSSAPIQPPSLSPSTQTPAPMLATTVSHPAQAGKVSSNSVLVFDGDGTAHAETQNIVAILTGAGFTPKTVASADLNAMTDADLAQYGLLVWPGGEAKTMSDSLTQETLTRVKNAVNNGLNYVGFCAGSFIAGSYTGPTWGLELIPLNLPYYNLENQGTDVAMVNASFADGTKRNLVWWGGPTLDGFGKVVAKYPDGTAAIAEGQIGKGFVVLSGVHPEAPQLWRDENGLNDTDGPDNDIALTIFQAAMNQKPLPSF